MLCIADLRSPKLRHKLSCYLAVRQRMWDGKFTRLLNGSCGLWLLAGLTTVQCSKVSNTPAAQRGCAHPPVSLLPLCKLPCQDSSLDSRFGELTVRLFSFPSLSSSSRTAIRVVASRVKWRRFLFWTAAMQQNIQGSQGIWITFHYRTQQGG